jgi:hypothetical protein
LAQEMPIVNEEGSNKAGCLHSKTQNARLALSVLSCTYIDTTNSQLTLSVTRISSKAVLPLVNLYWLNPEQQ